MRGFLIKAAARHSIFIMGFFALMMIRCSSPEAPKQVPRASIKQNPFDVIADTAVAIDSWADRVVEEMLPEGWVDLAHLEPRIIMDIRYATKDNFVETKLYQCARCLLRTEVAEALVQAQHRLEARGLGLKMFDCYRPGPVQQTLWNTLPDARYVTNPARGSMHNRGAAVDLTLVDSLGQELDMGTGFDYFGNRAYHTFRELDETILHNRRQLMKEMHRAGFRHIRTEWWHYAYEKESYELSDYLWPCP